MAVAAAYRTHMIDESPNQPEPPAQQVIAKAPDPAQRMATRRHLSAKALERKKERHRNAAKSITPTTTAKHHLGGH